MQYNIQSNDAQHALNTREIESIGLIFYISNDYYHSGRLTQEIGEQKKKKRKTWRRKKGQWKKTLLMFISHGSNFTVKVNAMRSDTKLYEM